ncbi:Oidioi.mRNA.OKI2018_I69.PAR.g13054.t1.cds [Oikopleura dioica]|uniref:Oidioi.mRNA.OKI2018_I69.PAR.g13054.t1.cds n=1 Tax=Oikopleura dioica TaxID=34765 RepID=A0ABN7S2Y9_OIKDI|nr:Oidioi.mRNA.OKI2018_I69.PAR.g13054.t1.cds [Oikopleura dioica]
MFLIWFIFFYKAVLSADLRARIRKGSKERYKESLNPEDEIINNQRRDFSVFNFSVPLAETCVDENLFNECYSLCRIEFLKCRENCENALCETSCERNFEDCTSSCPCGTNCPNGCLGCAHPICGDPNDPENIYILVFAMTLSESYIFSGDGLSQKSAPIDSEYSNGYADNAKSAFIQGQFYIIGGERPFMISRLDNCSLSLMPARLTNDFAFGFSAINIDDGQRGWTSLVNHPKIYHSHTLTGLESGAMIMAGGYDEAERDFIKDIWILNDEVWELIGYLKEYINVGSSLKIGDYIFIVSGYERNSEGLFPVERIKMMNDDLIDSVVIGGHDFESLGPPLLQTRADYCV